MVYVVDNLIGFVAHSRGHAFRLISREPMIDPDVHQHIRAVIAEQLDTVTLTALRKMHRSQACADAFLEGAMPHPECDMTISGVPYRMWRAARRRKQKSAAVLGRLWDN